MSDEFKPLESVTEGLRQLLTTAQAQGSPEDPDHALFALEVQRLVLATTSAYIKESMP